MKWRINHFIRGNEIRCEVTVGEGTLAEVVASLKIGTLHGNECKPYYNELVQVFADGLKMAAEKRGLL